MSRWHRPSCRSPTISVEDGLPYCQSCDTSPNIQKLVSEQKCLSPPWSVPPDESFDEMNLSWPESVLYSPQTQDTTMTDDGGVKLAEHLEPQDELPHIYNRRLESNEFRLLYLPAIDDQGRPIHANLEAYQIDDCPEYETVSYCWGGENGDTILCEPVFLGNYWDILLQTQNCWSMLHYLRPRLGVRVVWVDAICINQTDHQERENQVSIMGSIYQRCLRTVVYLGQDVVRPGSNGNRAYPARRDLNTESASAVDLRHLLKMRYFQRVWVIQELVLAPMVVIPVNGVELTARRHTATREEVGWHDSDAPWMRHICTGQSDTTLRVILEQTWNSQSTDPRDRVFGLLGFLPGSQGLRPNYLLSSLHIYIGTIAYMLLNEGYYHLLTEATGQRAPPTVPSWLPDGNISNLALLLRRLANLTSRLPLWYLSPEGIDWWHVLRLNSRWDIILLFPYRQSHSDWDRAKKGPGALEKSLPALEKPSIHPSTSALSLPLIYLCQFSSRPVLLRRDGFPSNAFEITVSNCTLYICTLDNSLDSVIEPGLTSVFLLKRPMNPPFLLFMRRSHSGANHRVLKCCHCLGIFLSRKPPSESWFPSSESLLSQIPNNYEAKPSLPTTSSIDLGQDCISILHRTVHSVVCTAQNLREESWKLLRGIRTQADGWNGDIANGHILSLFQKLSASPDTPFVDLYSDFLRHCCIACSIEVEGSGKEAWVRVTMNPRKWLKVHESLNSRWPGRGPRRYDPGPWFWARLPRFADSVGDEKYDVLETDYPSTTHQVSAWTLKAVLGARMPVPSWFHSQTVSMVAKEEGLGEWLKRSPYFQLFLELRISSRLVGGDEMILATTAPRSEYRSVCCYDWPECFFDGEHIPGKQENISIF